MVNKPLPPFGKALQLSLNRNIFPKNDIFLFMGQEAWEYGKSFCHQQTTLILPDGSDPNQYTWPVKGCSVLGFDTAFSASSSTLDKETIRKTAYVLLNAGALILRVILSNGALAVYRR